MALMRSKVLSFLFLLFVSFLSHVDAFLPAVPSVRRGLSVSRKSPSSSGEILVSHPRLKMTESNEDIEVSQAEGFDPKAWINPNTRGGVIVWSVILTILPVLFYDYIVGNGMDPDKAGPYVGVGFVALSMVGWALTYIFRVATKDMTYATQLRDYENAVLEKRLEELADDEINALMEEIESEP
jgi:hypothetical protein